MDNNPSFDIVDISSRLDNPCSSNGSYEHFVGKLYNPDTKEFEDCDGRNHYGDGRSYRTRQFIGRNVRIHFSIVEEEGQNVFEMLEARGTEPHQAYKQVIPEVLHQLGLDPKTKATWNRKAGCSMCPCSPGFVLSKVKSAHGHDDTVWVRVTLAKEGVVVRPQKLEKYVQTAERLRTGGLRMGFTTLRTNRGGQLRLSKAGNVQVWEYVVDGETQANGSGPDAWRDGYLLAIADKVGVNIMFGGL